MNPGRNDPCTCGSGKKYKKCCQDKVESRLSALSWQQNVNAATPGSPARGAAPSPDEFSQLVALYNARRHAELEGQARLLVERHPNFGLGWKLLSASLLMQGKDALPALQKAAKFLPGEAELHNNLGHALTKHGRSSEAEASFRRALAIKPDYADAHYNLGRILAGQDRPAEAEASLRRALEIQPNFAEAHNNLGSVLTEQDRLAEAEVSLRRALEIQPNFAEAHNNLGAILVKLDRPAEAEASYRQALEIKPDYAEAHSNLGNVLKDQGKLDEAIACHLQAIKLNPDFVEAYNSLGNALKDQGKLEAAITCYHKALELKPDYVMVHNLLGNALREQGNPDAASESFNRALALEPENVNAYIGLAGVYQDTGQFSTATTHLDQALALNPDHPVAWAFLPSLRKMTPDDLPWAEKAQHLLEGGPKLQEEMRLCYALGKYNDDIRQYEAAFGYYERANRLKRQFTGPFDRDDFRRHVDMIISIHTPETVRQQAGSSASCRPLLIVGMPRSGTSLTEQILASHPDVFGAGELRFWGQQVNAHISTMSSWYRDIPLLQGMASQYEAELLRRSVSALRVVDKMPGNFLYLGLIHAVFPQARILHTQRNPIDTCLSIYFQGFSHTHNYANDLDDLAFYYREYHRLMAHWRAVLPPEVFLDVPYEALVEDQEGWSRRIIEFTGLEWDERCLNFHETERKVGTASNWQVRQKIYKTSKERWRNYEKFVGPLLPLLELDERHSIIEPN